MAENGQNGQEPKKTEVFNWAKDSSMKEVYRKVWIQMLGPNSNDEFETFYTQCQTGRYHHTGAQKETDVNGTTFQEEIKRRIAVSKGIEPGEEVGNEKFDKARDKALKPTLVEMADVALEGKGAIAGVTVSEHEESITRTYFAQIAVDGFMPYDTATTAGSKVGQKMNLQMGCGEGKTGVLVYATAKYVQTPDKDGKTSQIFLTSSTGILAAETMEETAKKYDKLGVISSSKKDMVLISLKEIKYPKYGADNKMVLNKEGKPEYDSIPIGLPPTPEQKTALMEAYSKQIVVADNATIMQHKMAGCIPRKSDRFSERRLLADEADYVLLDQYHSAQKLGDEYSTEENNKRTDGRKIASVIAKRLIRNQANFKRDDANQYVDYTPAGKQFVKNAIEAIFNKDPNQPVTKQQLADFVYEAMVVEVVYKAKRDYQIVQTPDGPKIISEHRASGAEIDLPQGIQQALEIKCGLKPSVERKVERATNVTQVYKELFGNEGQQFISGTLGTKSESQAQLREMDNLQLNKQTTYDCLPKGESKRETAARTIFKDKKALRASIVSEAIRESEDGKGRPVLIGCVSDREVLDMIEQLKKSGTKARIIKYTAASENEYQEDMNTIKATDQYKDFEKDAAPINKEIENLEAEISKLSEGGEANKEKIEEIQKQIDSKNEILKEMRTKLKASLADSDVYKKFVEKYGPVKDDDKVFPADNFSGYIKHCSGKEGNIIVGTSIIGRGTTIKTNDAVQDKGGIHVIINGLHETSSRNQIQYAARTARGSENGSVHEIMCVEDFSPEIRSELEGKQAGADGSLALNESEVDGYYGKFYKEVDERQSNVRGHINKLISVLNQSYDAIDMAVQGQNIPEEDIVKAKALLTERAYSIQNRACGYAGNELEDEYTAEIEAFTELYIAKCVYKDAKACKEWEEENKELTDTYFEFSSEEEQEIVVNYVKGEIASGKMVDKEQVRKLLVNSGVNAKDVNKIIEEQFGKASTMGE